MAGFQLLCDAHAMRLHNGGGSPPPVSSFNNVLREGDSVTAVYDSYAHRYEDHRPDKTVIVRAENSRIIGTIANLNDNGNSMFGNVSEDLAYGPDLVTAMIGSNDMATGTATAYRNNLTNYYAAITANGAKFAWSPPPPYRNAPPLHPNYTNFTTERADLMATCRDPAVWGQWADYFIPMGEHPDFNDAAVLADIYGDPVHPNEAGHDRFEAVDRAAMDTILDSARASATAPYAAVWPVSQANLAVSTDVVTRIILSGLRPDLPHNLSVTGAQMRRNGGTYGASLVDCYNGDVIDVKVATSVSNSTAASYDLTIGSETRTITLTTGAAVDPVAYVHGGEAIEPNPVQNKTFTGLVFAEDGLAIIALTSNNGSPTSTALNGQAGAIIRRQALNANTGFDIISFPVVAGTHSLVVNRPSAASRQTLLYGYLKNADHTPTQQTGALTGYQSAPHETPSLTVPASGIALGWLFEDGGASVIPATAISPSEFIDEAQAVYQGATNGLAMAKRTTTGTIGFDFAFGLYPRAGVVFKALGT